MVGSAHSPAISVTPIGTVSTPFDTVEDPPRQGFELNARGELVLDERYGEGLDGLETGIGVDVV